MYSISSNSCSLSRSLAFSIAILFYLVNKFCFKFSFSSRFIPVSFLYFSSIFFFSFSFISSTLSFRNLLSAKVASLVL